MNFSLQELINYTVDCFQRLPPEEQRVGSVRDSITRNVIELQFNKGRSKRIEKALEKPEKR